MTQVTVDATRAISQLTDWEQTQVTYTVARALNDVAVDFQMQEYLHEKDIFTLRRPDWVRQSNKITHFANKAEPFATVSISPPGGTNRGDILGKFESDTTKQSITGGRIAVPIDARRGKANIVLPSQRPRAFNFRQVGNRIEGDRGTYIITKGDKQYIFQHKRGGDLLLYVLVRQTKITPDLDYVANAQWTMANKFQMRLDARWAETISKDLGGIGVRAGYAADPVAYLTQRGYSVV